MTEIKIQIKATNRLCEDEPGVKYPNRTGSPCQFLFDHVYKPECQWYKTPVKTYENAQKSNDNGVPHRERLRCKECLAAEKDIDQSWRRWLIFYEMCPVCGGTVEVYTGELKHNVFHLHDVVKCLDCGEIGEINIIDTIPYICWFRENIEAGGVVGTPYDKTNKKIQRRFEWKEDQYKSLCIATTNTHTIRIVFDKLDNMKINDKLIKNILTVKGMEPEECEELILELVDRIGLRNHEQLEIQKQTEAISKRLQINDSNCQVID